MRAHGLLISLLALLLIAAPAKAATKAGIAVKDAT